MIPPQSIRPPSQGKGQLILALLTAISGIPAVMALVMENQFVVASIAWVICIVLLVIVLVRRNPSALQNSHGLPAGHLLKYSRLARIVAMIGIAGLVVAPAGYWAWRIWPTDKTIILLADFAGPDTTYRMTYLVLEELHKLERQYPEMRAVALRRAITPDMRDDVVQNYMDQHQAALVVWGWYAATEEGVLTNVQFRMRNGIELPVVPASPDQQQYSPSELNRFAVQLDVAGRVGRVAQLALAAVRVSKNDLPAALEVIDEVLEQKPRTKSEQRDYPTMLYLRAIMKWDMNDTAGAMSDADKAVANDPRLGGAIDLRGVLAHRQGRLDYAIQQYDSAIAVGYTGSYKNRGMARTRTGDIDGALADYDSSLARDTHFVVLYNQASLLAMFRQDSTRGLAAANALVRKWPVGISFQQRALVKMKFRDFEGALSDITAARQRGFENTDTWLHLSIAYYLLHNFPAALAAADTGLQLDPDSEPRLYLRRGLAHKALNHRDEAQADMHQFARRRPEPSVYTLEEMTWVFAIKQWVDSIRPKR